MAQFQDSRRTDALRPQNSSSSRSSRIQSSPDRSHRSQGNASSWSLKLRKNHDHDDHGAHHHKKSVLMKVKEKARKLKKTLSGKKRREENELGSPYSTPPAGVGGSLADDEKEESEFFGSPLHESEGTNKPAAKDRSREANTSSSKKMEEPPSTMAAVQSNQPPSSHSTFTDSLPENTNPKSNSEQKADKGVSVKEYLMQKLEPGEDERALSQVITRTISFRRTEEPDTSPADSGSNRNPSAGSSTEPHGLRSSLLNGSSGSNHGLRSSLSNASNLSLVSSSMAASSNLKPNPSSSSSQVRHADNNDETRRRVLQPN